MRGKALVVAGVMVAAIIVPATSATAAVDDINTTRLRNAVSANGILKHERVFQRIANLADGTRASGTPGYLASALYVAAQLRLAGYKVSQQKFDFPFYDETAPATLSQVSPTPADYEVSTLTYSGSGEVVGEVVPATNLVIPATEAPSSAAGCVVGDYLPAAADVPQVALVQRGTCTFAEKAAAAVEAGYDAVIIFNEGNPGRTELLEGTLGADAPVPVVGTSYETGVALAGAGPITVSVSASVISEVRQTYNIIADSPKGDPNKVVVVGAHLDSVTEGPGINDNGSGSAAILEIALQGAKLGITPRQKVRFAFWGAEELGLLGSQYYVDTLSDEKLGQIYANLNFDMLGSTNYVRFVYDGDGSEGTAGPAGSGEIERVFNDYFASQGLATSPTAFDGRSDYGPFIGVGIPAGGLFSGAEGIKTAEEAATYGGTAGAPYDPCYHLACDTTNNLSSKALGELGDAAAHAVATLALTRSGLFEDGSRVAVRQPVPASEFDYRGSALVR